MARHVGREHNISITVVQSLTNKLIVCLRVRHQHRNVNEVFYSGGHNY
jgi:hypothetical protein